MSDQDRTDSSEQELDTQASNPNAGGPDRLAGGMGVSSERTGPTGPGQDATDGVRPTDSSAPTDADGNEVDADGNEVNPGDRPDPTTRF